MTSAVQNSIVRGRWALVTGSSRGIGQEIALGLARLGAHVIVHGRSLEHCDATLGRLAEAGLAGHAVAGDLATAAGVQAVIDGVHAVRADGVDILYNNAAINNVPTPVFEFAMDEWQRTFQINVFAMVQLCAAFVPGMSARKFGRVVNLTSGIAGQPNLAPYSASKAAVDKYTDDLACACKADNVLVNRVDPGWIKTDLGGPDAWESVDTVVPGVLVPALLEDNGPTGRFFAAQDFKGLWGSASLRA